MKSQNDKVFEFDGYKGSFAEFHENNIHDDEFCNWILNAEIGDIFDGCKRIQ